MLELVSVLMNILIVEGALLVALNVVILGLILKQMYESKESVKKFKDVALSFRQKVYSNERYSNICKAAVVLYGLIKLTALWCFSILLGIAFTPSIWGTIMILVAEILIIALQVRNKFVLNSEDVIDLKWIMLKAEKLIQKKLPSFSVRNGYEKVRYSIQGCFKKENKAK